MTTPTPAWLITIGQHTFALAEKEMIEYVIEPQYFDVPVTPEYCSRVLQWRDSTVPIMDLGRLTGDTTHSDVHTLVVVAHQREPYTPLHYLGLVISSPPVRIVVDDEQACDAPEDIHPLLADTSLAYFQHADRAVPVLDLRYLCSEAFLLKATQKN